MKKIALVTLLVLGLTCLFAGAAWAEQAKLHNVDESGSVVGGYEFYFLPTTVEQVYDEGHLSRLQSDSKFNADGYTYYPYEIYLPNEGKPEDYRIHSNYTKDTDACASCHATHTAVGPGLLQWTNVYKTCMACHDGTVTTTYNVQEGVIGTSSTPTFGGMFGGEINGTYEDLSNHNVTGAVNIAAAPGGSTVPVYADVDQMGTEEPASKNQPVQWGVQFGCESCHNPHGQGGNARILNPDPNGWATLNKMTEIATQTAEGTYVVYPADDSQMFWSPDTPYYMLRGYPYKIEVKVNGQAVEFTADSSKGYTEITLAQPTNDPVEVTFYPALRVTMDIDNYLQSDEIVKHKSGINAFCGACHTDYNTEKVWTRDGLHPGSDAMNGTYSQAYRHAVGVEYDYNESGPAFIGNGDTYQEFLKLEEGKITCLTCHLAHGTSKDYWTRTLGNAEYIGAENTWTDDEMDEIAGSSALKRMPNMGTCEACHEKAVANQGYAAAVTGGEVTTDPYVDRVKGIDDGQFSPEGAEFAGKEACAGCHADIVASFNETAHANMLTFTTAEERDEWVTKLGWNDDQKEYPVAGGSGSVTITKDDLVLNLNWNKDGVIGRGDDDRLYILAEAGEVFTEAEQYGCVKCHITPKDKFAGDYTWTEFKAAIDTGEMELGIQCEDCHGNGSKHVQTPSAKNILNPANFTMQQQSDNSSEVGCGRCHGGRHHQGEFWNNVSVDWNNNHEEDSWEGDVGTGPSPHYISGVVSCATCHDPHGSVDDYSRNDEKKEGVQLKMTVRALCNSCHENMLVDKADFDQYLPLKANGMPGHLFNGNGKPDQAPDPVHEHRVVE
ncbi:cytochrome c3 family protein [Calderihabitans maritimus]|uniref:Doubled CXXCH domain-containing protein n=1 Tax=Calderihabitans maritimus TaxID=1246530 RepID=A0A1Z5HQM7_9FIRM|nr:cytochrome c3 family protein [Calderihabitans maritimus]GAW91829.1 doubled CXXCH domain-containing protein [Calderihabitans maritimus]